MSDKAPQMCYYKRTGFHQIKMNRLEDLIPENGPIQKLRKNSALENLRKAINVYFDLYHNNLVNRRQSFYPVFGFRSTDYREMGSVELSHTLYLKVEKAMDDKVMAAWLEQKALGTV